MPCSALRMSRRLHLLAPLLLLWLLAPAVGAQEAVQDMGALKAAVQGAVPDAGAPGTTVEPLVDERLRLPACGEPLEARAVRTGTVEVRCAAPAWRLFVPVRIQRTVPVLVVRRMIAPQAAVEADAVAVETREVAGLAAPGLSDPAQAIGQLARRMLVPGTVITARDLVAPPVVRRGDAVALVARSGGIEVRVEGRALGNAAIGERVNVENVATRRIVQARARAPGEVEAATR